MVDETIAIDGKKAHTSPSAWVKRGAEMAVLLLFPPSAVWEDTKKIQKMPSACGGSAPTYAKVGNWIMLIRYGYELTFACPQPTMMVCLLDAHRERSQELRYEIPPTTIPAIPTRTYLDTFGNTVRRFVAPPGDLTITSDAIIDDSGLPDSIELDADEVPVEQLPDETLVFLLGSRYRETDKLADIAWQHFASTARGWHRVQAICDFVCDHLTFGYEHARATRTAFEAYQERIGVCRDFAHLAVPFCRCMNIPARYANGFLGDIGVLAVSRGSPDNPC